MTIRRLPSISLAILGATLLPLLVHAQVQQGGGKAAKAHLFESIEDVIAKACVVVNWLFTGAIILTIVFVLLAAIKYITKGSDPAAIKEAHQMLMWAAIGFAVALMAAVAPDFIAAIFDAKLDKAC